MKKAAILFFTCILISGCVLTREATKRQILNLNTQHFKDTIIIKQVSSGDVTKFSTLKGYRHEKYLGIGWLDSFLIGYLNNKTGKRLYQVYQFISYQGPGWSMKWKITSIQYLFFHILISPYVYAFAFGPFITVNVYFRRLFSCPAIYCR